MLLRLNSPCNKTTSVVAINFAYLQKWVKTDFVNALLLEMGGVGIFVARIIYTPHSHFSTHEPDQALHP